MAEGSRARTQGIAGTWPPREAARAGRIAPSGFSTWSSLAEKLRAWVRAEAGAGRLLPWVPVAFGAGIAFYIAADHEPVLPVAAGTAAALCAAAFFLRRQKLFPVAVLIAAMAAGFATATWKTARLAHGGLSLRYAAFMQNLRDAIDARIRTTLEGDKRAIATALLTGRRDAITTPVNDAMFISGLGHVLSISGYHMAVVAGVVFFAVRALLALIPVLTVTFPIKKWSAAAALAAALFYLLLSGAEVATQRSFFMTAVVLIAVMVDRRAITFRTLAVAAMIVLSIAPEALVHPSFQSLMA